MYAVRNMTGNVVCSMKLLVKMEYEVYSKDVTVYSKDVINGKVKIVYSKDAINS